MNLSISCMNKKNNVTFNLGIYCMLTWQLLLLFNHKLNKFKEGGKNRLGSKNLLTTNYNGFLLGIVT